MTTVSMKLPDQLAQELTSQAERHQTSKSALMREALVRYLELLGSSEPRPVPGSFLERARHLAGCVVEAPPDLSSNKEHLEGYGR